MSTKLSGDEKRIRIFELEDIDYTSEYFLFIAFSILESQGYQNLIEIMSIIEDPKKIIQILYLLNGMDLKLPTASELTKALKASGYIYMDTIKARDVSSGEKRGIRPVFLRSALKINENEESEILKIYEQWAVYMEKNGYSIDDYLPIVTKRAKDIISKIRKTKKYIPKTGIIKKRKVY